MDENSALIDTRPLFIDTVYLKPPVRNSFTLIQINLCNQDAAWCLVFITSKQPQLLIAIPYAP
jgi:hypothetical protein